MRRFVLVACAVVLTAACGDDDAGDQVVGEIGGEEITLDDLEEMGDAMDALPTCEDLYADGNVVTEDEVQEGCKDDDGDVVFSGIASYDCTDGGELMWNDHGWWIDGEGVHLHEPGDDAKVPPDDVIEACQGG